MQHPTGPAAPKSHTPSSDAPRLVRRGARAILLDDDASLVLIRRTVEGGSRYLVAQGQDRYWVTPGGGIEPDDESVEAACRRELFEELGATARLIRQVYLASRQREGGVKTQHFFLARLLTMDIALRNGPEFSDPSRGSYDVERIDFRDPDSLTGIALWPADLVTFLQANRVALLLEAGLKP